MGMILYRVPVQLSFLILYYAYYFFRDVRDSKELMKILFITLLACLSLGIDASELDERKERIKRMTEKVSELAESRKVRSEAVLSQNKVPVNTHLPYIEDESEALVRSKEEVAKRAMALIVVAVKAEGLEQEVVEYLVQTYDLRDVFSPNEVKFIDDKSPSQFDNTQFVWRYEAAWVLLWSLGFVDALEYPSAICDVAATVNFLQQRSKEQFIDDSQLRPITEILDQADLIYRYHWAVVDARVNGKPSPSELDSSVVMERHYALNWLIGYMNQDWDNITTDT